MSSDRDALFRAILAHPDEDTPRLAYADWLDENGDTEFARFIRTQVELAKVPEWDSLPLRLWHQDRHMVTGVPFRDRFSVPMETPSGWPTQSPTFRRGFP